MSAPDHRAVVAKKSSLVDKMTKYKLQELRLIAYCLAHYDSRKPKNSESIASVEDMRAIYPSMDKKSAYAVIRETVKGLGSKPLEFEEDGELIYWNWFSGFRYKKNEGTFKFYITPELQPYLLDLKGTFTRYRLQDIYQFRSATTWKLYEHLKKCWDFDQSWSVDLVELKIKLGIPGKYARWSDFRDRVIDPAIDEINKHSDISVTWKKKKRSRRVIGVVFFVDAKQPDDVITIENPREKIHKLLLIYGVNEKTAQDYTEKIDLAGRTDFFVNQIPTIKKRWEVKSKNVPLPKYLIGAIKNELQQRDLPFGAPPSKAKYADALDCWQQKRRVGEQCKVRVRGVAGQRKKCQLCLENLPIDQFGI